MSVKQYKSWTGTLVAIVLTIWIAYSVYLDEMASDLERLTRQQAQLIQELAIKTDRSANLHAYKQQNETMLIENSQLQRTLPSRFDNRPERVHEQLVGYLEKHGGTISGFSTGEWKQYEFYAKQAYALEMRLPFSSLLQLIVDINNQEHLADVSSVSMRADGDELLVRMDLSYYFYLDEEGS